MRFFGVPPLLVAEHDTGFSLEQRRTPDEGSVVAKEPVPMQGNEFVHEEVDVVERVGTLGVAGQLHPLPGGEVAVDPALELLELDFERLQRLGRFLAGGRLAGFLEAMLQLSDRFFEVVPIPIHLEGHRRLSWRHGSPRPAPTS
jgi:hypothetical protein